MQTWSSQNNGQRTLSPTRKFTATVLLLFSLAGLIAGFAFGGLNGSKSPSTTTAVNPIKKPTAVVHNTATATPTPTPPPDIVLGFPQFDPAPISPESAASGTTYTVGMQAVDKQKKVVHSSDVTCKIWLVQQIPAGKILSIDKNTLKAVSNLTMPIQGTVNGQPAPEVQNALVFDSTTPSQTTHCDANGQMTWKYQISPTTPPGKYDLVILADWKGIHYNWYWVDITIK